MIAASIWLIRFDSEASGFATTAFFLAGLADCALVAFLALRAFVVALVVLVLVVIVSSPLVSMVLAAIIRPGEPPPDDARRRFGLSWRHPRRVWFRTRAAGPRRCRAPRRRLRRHRLLGHLRRPRR